MSRRIEVGAPYHFEATIRLLQRRPANVVDVWEDGYYRRALWTPDGPVAVQVRNHGTVDEPDMRYVAHPAPGAGARSAVEADLRRLLGAHCDPALLQRVARLARGGAVLADAAAALHATAAALRGVRIPRYTGLFEAFANVVPFQQVSLDSGIAITGRIAARFGSVVEVRGQRYRAFPLAATIAEARAEALRECGLSARKAETLLSLARLIASGRLSEARLEHMETDDALAALTALPGIGPWSAALVLLRGLGRADVFPPGDVGAARVLGDLLKLGPDVDIANVAQAFGPVRGGLYFCALGSALLANGGIEPAPAVHAAPGRRGSQVTKGAS